MPTTVMRHAACGGHTLTSKPTAPPAPSATDVAAARRLPRGYSAALERPSDAERAEPFKVPAQLLGGGTAPPRGYTAALLVKEHEEAHEEATPAPSMGNPNRHDDGSRHNRISSLPRPYTGEQVPVRHVAGQGQA